MRQTSRSGPVGTEDKGKRESSPDMKRRRSVTQGEMIKGEG